MMTYRDIIKNTVSKLNEASIEDADFEARILLQHCFNLSYMDYIVSGNNEAAEDKLLLMNKLLERRLNNFPLQYLIGEWDFFGRTFKVGEGVLIPRPETELLAEEILNYCKETNNNSPIVFDLCSGSGCIGLTLAKELPGSKVWCVEKSPEAFEYLSQNKKLLSADNAECLQGDILNGYKGFNLPAPDIIVSNPPYIRSDEIPKLQKEVLFEPKMALDGGEDGYIFYRALAQKWQPYLKAGGAIFIECGENQGKTIAELFNNEKTKKVGIIHDYQNLDRIVCAFNR